MSDKRGMATHFGCTACGKCCYGCIPLTLSDALSHAHRFPLALVWTAVPQGNQAFALIAQMGITLKPKKQAQIAVLIAPTAYIPPEMACPALADTGLCTIHDHKPLRCRSMPFYPYRAESEQADVLRPRAGWLCDTSVNAPLVYRDRRIIDRGDFEQERSELMRQAATMRQYADYMLKYMPWITDNLVAQARQPGGNVVTSLSSFLTAIKHLDAAKIATQQRLVLGEFAAKTAGDESLLDYHRHYAGWAKEMDYLAR